MASKLNFFLGIKQLSLHNKEVSMCTPPTKITGACLLDLDFTASRSRHGSTSTVLKIHKC